MICLMVTPEARLVLGLNVGRPLQGQGDSQNTRPPFEPLTEGEADAQLDVPLIPYLTVGTTRGAVKDQAVGRITLPLWIQQSLQGEDEFSRIPEPVGQQQ